MLITVTSKYFKVRTIVQSTPLDVAYSDADLELGASSSLTIPDPRQPSNVRSTISESIQRTLGPTLSTCGSTTSELTEDMGSGGSISPLSLDPGAVTLSSTQTHRPSAFPARRYTAASCFDFGVDMPSKLLMYQRSNSLGIAATCASTTDSVEDPQDIELKCGASELLSASTRPQLSVHSA